MENSESLPILTYDRALPIAPTFGKKTAEFSATLERACVAPYVLPGHGLIYALRPPTMVTNPARVAAYRNLVVCDNHPSVGDSHRVGKGLVLEGVADGDSISGRIVIHDADLLERIYAGKQQLSPGYLSYYTADSGEFEGVRYTFVQHDDATSESRGLDHIAVVDAARQGETVRLNVTDSADLGAAGLAIALTWEQARQPIYLTVPTQPTMDAITDTTTEKIMDETQSPGETQTPGALADLAPLTATTQDEIPDLVDAPTASPVDTSAADNDSDKSPEDAAAADASDKMCETCGHKPGAGPDSKMDQILDALKSMSTFLAAQYADDEAEDEAETETEAEPEAETKTEAEPETKSPTPALTADSLSAALTLVEQGRSVGLAVTAEQIIADPVAVRQSIAGKLKLVTNDSMSGRDLEMLIAGAMSSGPVRQGTSIFSEQVTTLISAKKESKPHPLAGL